MSEAGEPDWTPGRIVAVSDLAAEIGLQAGDELLAVNDRVVRDVIDVQFHAAEPELELLVRRDGDLWLFEAERAWNQPLGIEFENPTFDTDIRLCNNQCLFCFVTQMAPPRHGVCAGAGNPFRRSLYVKDDDYRYSFLEGNYVTLTNLNPADWQRIEEQRLSPLYVSVHSTDVELRRRLLGNAAAPDVLQQLRQLAGWGIEVHTQLVVAPGLNDGESLVRSVADLAALWPAVQSISVVPVGLTRFHHRHLRPNTAAEAVAVLAQVEKWQQQFLGEVGERLVYAADEWYLLADRPVPPLNAYPQLEALEENGVGLVSGFLDDWRRLRSRVKLSRRQQRLTLVTAPLFARVLEPVAAEFGSLSGLEVTVKVVSNQVLGESITVAGLLMGQDLVGQVERIPADEWLLLPAVMFRGPGGVTLDGLSVEDVATAVGGRVWLVETMSDIWAALQGRA